MKLLASLFLISLFSCSIIENASTTILNPTNNSPSKIDLTNEEVISGLKEALNVGIKNAVNLSSVTDGFLKNDVIRLPFPPDAIKVREKAINFGLSKQVTTFEETLNRAAEEATKKALPIFIDAIKNMSVSDGFSILKGGDGAATKFLKSQTSNQLVIAFAPVVKEATTKVQLTAYWNPIITRYNSAMTLSGGQKLDPDLDAYITQKAIDGLFYLVETEENKIRKDPLARVSDILVKVFGSLF
ncbi:MAG: DUF4197 domain-containing protein [Crocinitomicaceae bacterium]|nr:DUF4197 domain-containing protein [Crocinitomicaceae bacterium]